MSPSTLEGGPVLRNTHRWSHMHGYAPLAEYLKDKGKSKAPFPESLKLETLDEHEKSLAHMLKSVRDSGYVYTPGGAPLFLWHSNIASGRPEPKNAFVHFLALGANSPLSDAVTIRLAHSLLKEFARGPFTISVNSMGDAKETRARFQKDLTNFFRKHAGTYAKDIADVARRDPIEAALMFMKGDYGIDVPRPTDHLSEASRKHFESVLEYLEATNTPFELAQNLFYSNQTWHDTLFEITNEAESVSVAGARFSDFSKHFFRNTSIPSLSTYVKLSLPKHQEVPSVRLTTQPTFVMVHIGPEAKKLSMTLANELAEARVSAILTLPIESMTAQMLVAEKYKPRYLLVVGRQEAVEGVVTVRNTDTYNEVKVPIDKLIPHLVKVAR